ncbi:MAG: nucleoside phosphorylase [Desulfosarcinaceae bacterium]
MTADDPVVRPVCNARTPVLGPTALLVASHLDLKMLAGRLQLPDSRQLYMSRLLYDAGQAERPCLVGPLMGAPYAVMILEILRAWGVRKVLFFGWCGSIDPVFRIGDIVIPTSALIDEGTSLHYRKTREAEVHPDRSLCAALQADLDDNGVDYKTGRVWTTDGIFRETPNKIEAFQRKGANVVEMELSAIYSLAAFHDMAAAALLAVSDELFTLTWKPGFTYRDFSASRNRIIERISAGPMLLRTETG